LRVIAIGQKCKRKTSMGRAEQQGEGEAEGEGAAGEAGCDGTVGVWAGVRIWKGSQRGGDLDDDIHVAQHMGEHQQ
jgi:hypothetical protein